MIFPRRSYACSIKNNNYGEVTMKLNHIALYVRDLEAAKLFFLHYFDAVSNEKYYNQRTGFQSYFLTFADGGRLEIMTKPGLGDCNPAEEQMGFTHVAFSVGSKEKVDELTEQLHNDGFRIISGPRTTGDGYYESCVEGPEGNRIEITI